MENYLRSGAIALVLLLLQMILVPFISIEGMIPDLLLIYVVFVAIKRGQIEATLTGFCVGFAQDLTALHFLGLAALAKTIAGFTTGYFFNENKTDLTMGTYRFIGVVLLGAMVHNIIYTIIFFQGRVMSPLVSIIQYSIGTSVYTGLLSALLMFYMAHQIATAPVR
jgi:rod shape-determining protein MreD